VFAAAYLGLQLDLETFGGGAHFGKVVPRIANNFVDNRVGVVGIVMLQD